MLGSAGSFCELVAGQRINGGTWFWVEHLYVVKYGIGIRNPVAFKRRREGGGRDGGGGERHGGREEQLERGREIGRERACARARERMGASPHNKRRSLAWLTTQTH